MHVDSEDVLDRFGDHELSSAQRAQIATVRAGAKTFARVVLGETPASREQAVALTKLEEAAMFAVKAIARGS